MFVDLCCTVLFVFRAEVFEDIWVFMCFFEFVKNALFEVYFSYLWYISSSEKFSDYITRKISSIETNHSNP